MTATTTTARIDPQTQEELMRQAGIWIEHSTLIEDDLPARPLAAVQAEKHQLDRYTQLVADRAAARDSKCLAQIEEPAQPVCWIRFCSDGSTEGPIMHSQICEARKTSGAWTPLYAVAAPAAVAPQGEYPQLPEGVMCIEQVGGEVIGRPTDYGFKHGRGIVHGAELFTSEQLRAYFDLGRQSAPAAPALEAPAAPAGWKLVPAKPTDAMLGAAQKAWLADPLRRSSTLYVAALAAAPQAPAAPSTWAGPVRELMGHLSDVLGDEAFAKIDTTRWNAVSALIGGAPAAPAAPAVDASDTDLLDAMERERIAVIPEFEGPWDAQIFGEDEATLACGSGVTPRKAIAEALASLEARKAHDAAQAAAKGGGIVSKTERLGHANALIEIISRHGRRFFRNRESGAIARLELDASGRLWWIDEYRGSRVYTGKVMGYPHRWRGFSHGGTLRSLVEALRGYVLRGELLHPEYIAPSRIDPTNGDIWGYGAEAAAAVRAEAHALPLFQRPTGHKEST